MKNEKVSSEQKIQSTIDQMTYMDDDFFTACLQNNTNAALLILRIVMRKPDLTIVNLPQVQYTIKDLGHKSIRLDLYCKSEGKRYDVEIQRRDKGAGFHRARYYLSLIDASLMVPGEDYDSLPDVYVIFITQNDILKAGRPYYTIERKIEELDNQPIHDGAHILYVNGAYHGDDSFGKLMHDFRCANPHDMYHDELKKPAIFFKETEEGRKQMSEAVEKLVNEGKDETRQETAEKMIRKNKYSDEEISDISGLTVSEVQKIKREMLAMA